MGVGPKIKELRNKAGLTQKELADKLHVTYQAVSRWENDDAEPSIDTLKEMCSILNCSIEELFDMNKKESEQEVVEKVVEKVVVQEQKPMLAVCEKCNKPIYDPADLNRVSETRTVRVGRQSHNETKNSILCKSCNDARIDLQNKLKEQAERQRRYAMKKQRIHSFIWPSIIAVLFIAVAIYCFTNIDAQSGALFLGISVFAYCFAATMILNNTFITDLWLEVSSWGFVKLPGIIFEFSFDGLVFLIAMKILFFIVEIAVAVIVFAAATALAMILSLFVYPVSLIKNFKYIE